MSENNVKNKNGKNNYGNNNIKNNNVKNNNVKNDNVKNDNVKNDNVNNNYKNNNNYKESKDFRKESKKQEKKMYLILGIAAFVLMIAIIFINNLFFGGDKDTEESQDTGAQTTIEETMPTEESLSDVGTTSEGGTEASQEVGDTSESLTEVTQEVGTASEDRTEVKQEVETASEDVAGASQEVAPETQTCAASYKFRNNKLLNQHYEKHGIEMGFESAAAYEAAASAVINNPDALSKTEAEDGDLVYYVEATNEFVILSTDGYIRTYFLPSGGKAYYDRQ